MSGYEIPGASIYGQGVAGAKLAYQNALAKINKGRSDTFRTFGYKADFDPESGVTKNLQVDPYNQYGQYQRMLRQHANQGSQSQDMARERGLSTSGGLGAQYERQNQYDFGQDSSNMGQSFGQMVSQLQEQQNEAKYGYDASLYQAQLEAARNAAEAGDFSDSGYPGGGGDGPSGGDGPNDGGDGNPWSPYPDDPSGNPLHGGPTMPPVRVARRPPPRILPPALRRAAAGFGGGLGAARIASRPARAAPARGVGHPAGQTRKRR